MDFSHVRFRAARTVTRPLRPGSRSSATPTLEDADSGVSVDGLPAAVLTHAGLDAGVYRAAPLRRRVAACLSAVRAPSETAALVRLERDRTLHPTALNTRWRVDDITKRVPGGPWDLVSCRNVLMYLQAASLRLASMARCVHQYDGP